MGDYTPDYVPGHEITLQASATITGGQVVAVSGSGTVAPAGAASPAVVGVAAFDAATNGSVTVFARGITHISTASGAITAAARVDAGAAGTVASATAGVTNIGVALTTAADGASVTWMEI
ncbi:capsid cement protein [Micromonospora sp. NBC_00421]|uniref:capsid cement protein n=1 Tax=Micromonospora sp. NBC_00421 TaxID=2975976 RepID=UPI002E1B5B85